MKILIIIWLMVLAGCASQPKEQYIKDNRLVVASKGNYSQNVSSHQKHIPVGIWEGISRSGAEFKVLTITPGNQHILVTYKIASGMQFHKTVTFTDKDIKCDEFNCHILTRTPDENLPLKITLTERVGQHYLVTEAVRLASKEIHSFSYELNATNAKPIPERFIEQKAKSVTEIVSVYKRERFGYWSGVLEVANENQLKFVTLEYLPEQIATFTVYSPGMSSKAVMNFNPEWLQQSNGELKTKLEGSPFTSEIALRYKLRDMIEGDLKQHLKRYPERLIQYGNFQLFRVQPPEEYKLPAWLETFLQEE